MKKLIEISRRYKISLLSAANTFYIMLLLIPLDNIGFDFSKLKIDGVLDIYKWGILFLINIVFVSTKYIHNLKNTNLIIFNIENSKNFNYLKALLLTVMLIIIVSTLIIISYGLIDVWMSVLHTNNYVVIKIFEIIVAFSILLLIVMLIFKYTIPMNVNYNKIFKISALLSLIWLVMSTFYQNIMSYLLNKMFDKSEILLFSIYFIYFANYVFVFAYVCNFCHLKDELNTENRLKYNEHLK